MKQTNLLYKTGLVGISAILIFLLPSCDGGGKDGVRQEVVTEQEALQEDSYGENEVLYDGTEVVKVVEESSYKSWDANSDDQLDEAEWEEGWHSKLAGEEFNQDLYHDWDTDANQLLSEEEFKAGFFAYYDADGSSFWDETEFIRFASTSYYNTWDQDNNNKITEKEFADGWNSYMAGYTYEEELYNLWDVNNNGTLDKGEFTEGIFDYWDADDTGYVEANEYALYNRF